MYLVINKCVTAVKVSNFSGHYLRNRSPLDIDVLGYIGIVQHKEHSPEVLSIPTGTPCIYLLTAIEFTPGDSSTVHIYTQKIHRTTQLIWEECGPCPAVGVMPWHLPYN